MPAVIPVVGGKKAGKTTTIESLVKDLTQRGYRVAVVKRIPEADFTIDTKGKDTWRFARAGAKIVVGVSSKEVATIENVSTAEFSFGDVLRRCGNADIVFLEGFRRLAALDKHFPKIVVAKCAEDVEEAVATFAPILAFSGPYNARRACPTIPYVDAMRNPRKLADYVEELVQE